jgi:hypothetical protein
MRGYNTQCFLQKKLFLKFAILEKPPSPKKKAPDPLLESGALRLQLVKN